MNPTCPRPLVPLALLALVIAPVASHAQVLDPIVYTLRPGSAFEYGCFGPCECPVLSSTKLSGTFTFYRTSVDPLYTHYALLNIDWMATVPDTTGATHSVHVTGDGTYDYGGEVAVTQRMTLDVTLDGRGPLHFDSGTEPARAGFPAIDATAFLHGNACFDSAFRVVAAPNGVADVVPFSALRLLRAPQPNPFAAAVRIGVDVPRESRVRVDILDASGRIVRPLLDQELPPGEHDVTWNGTRAGGAAAGPGIYWVRARDGAEVDMRRVTRVH